MAIWVTLYLLWFPQPWFFQHYFSRLHYFQTSHRLSSPVAPCYPMKTWFWLKHSSHILSDILMQNKGKQKYFWVTRTSHDTKISATLWTLEQEHRNCKGKWPWACTHEEVDTHKHLWAIRIWRCNEKNQLVCTSVFSFISLFGSMCCPRGCCTAVLLVESSGMSNTQGST